MLRTRLPWEKTKKKKQQQRQQKTKHWVETLFPTWVLFRLRNAYYPFLHSLRILRKDSRWLVSSTPRQFNAILMGGLSMRGEGLVRQVLKQRQHSILP